MIQTQTYFFFSFFFYSKKHSKRKHFGGDTTTFRVLHNHIIAHKTIRFHFLWCFFNWFIAHRWVNQATNCCLTTTSNGIIVYAWWTVFYFLLRVNMITMKERKNTYRERDGNFKVFPLFLSCLKCLPFFLWLFVSLECHPRNATHYVYCRANDVLACKVNANKFTCDYGSFFIQKKNSVLCFFISCGRIFLSVFISKC